MKALLSRCRRYMCRTTILLNRDRHFVSPKMFQGCRIIVVGPAETALEDCDASFVEEFDLVVRINSGLNLTRLHGDRIGRRTDILAHSLYEGGSRGTGEIKPEALAEAGTKLILCPLPSGDKWVPYLALRRRMTSLDWSAMGSTPEIRLTPDGEYLQLRARLGGIAPTTGLALLNHLMHTDFVQLHVTGFTFFGGAYAPGYKSGVEGAIATRKWGADSKHAPDIERAVFVGLLNEARQKGLYITLDRALSDIVACESDDAVI